MRAVDAEDVQFAEERVTEVVLVVLLVLRIGVEQYLRHADRHEVDAALGAHPGGYVFGRAVPGAGVNLDLVDEHGNKKGEAVASP